MKNHCPNLGIHILHENWGMMNKVLSELQRFILLETYLNDNVTNADILIKWYGFKPSYSYRGKKFNRHQIGMKRYLSASVAASRSLTRLEARGLLKRTIDGFGLTEKGTAQAVNFAPHFKKAALTGKKLNGADG